jgi:hypothetical protein
MVLRGTLEIAVVGNLFSGVRPKALAAEGEPSRCIPFCDNVLVDSPSDDEKLETSSVENNLPLSSRD